ncbi:hypothetical protein [Streptomyces sp. NPDC056169]|uniref:hypothetical protein n=1 Tax=Streptomyces sp. NPDC056169 TaxID=3345734 RepID=UPI0035D5775B
MVEASSEETGTVGTSVDGVTEAEAAETRAEAEVAVETDAGVEAGSAAADVVEVTAGTEPADDAHGVDTDEPAAGAVASEVVEIPKQQSAEAAADNEAGEGARK